ncbi:Transducin/WD40 repeat-like superfamily protein [Theobroma cacao]|uniref:Transducin/WD40 repeat-like superfamily protein n=1 Tax=Theobroma cacao TaxID=3641 RepID=A0A061FZJ4_THECC|nr:Transducin/WD40 repeat-like superfamily protein [Theobroma cacao]
MSSQLHVFPLQTLKHRCLAALKTRSPHISCLAVRDNLLYAAAINEINVFDLSNHSPVDSFNDDPTSGFVKSIAFNKTKIFTAHQDGKIRIWEITLSKKHQLLTTLPTVKDRFLHFILPKNYVNVRRHKKRLWIEHWDTVSGLVILNQKELMYSVSWDKSFKIWNVNNRRCLESVKAHEDAVNTLVVSDNGTVYTGSADGLISVWERANKERRHSLVATLDKHKSTVNALALNADGSVLFSGGCDRSIMVWEKKGENNAENDHVGFVEALWGHSGPILCLINVGDLFVSGSSDRTVRVWQRGKEGGFHCSIVLEGHEKPVKSLVAVARGVFEGVFTFCSGSLDREIRVWEISRCSNLKNKSHEIRILLDGVPKSC